MFQTENTTKKQSIVVGKVRYCYVPIQQTIKSEDLGTYISYGISVRAVEDEIIRVSDVSTEYDTVARLAQRCTENELDPIHLGEVIEDFLAVESAILI